ncbi:MAG: tRNA (adenine-N1)-methyltransferase [candidate division WOR-3 bacterium]|nr:MAG: tRNA (adenine-N1)-methyltransferase [candidate division WOR-3 bacterium]
MVKPGDIVYLYHSERMKYLVEVPEKGHFSTHRGNIQFEDVLKQDLGGTVQTQMGFRFHILKPTLSDLEMKVRRTTTIVYPKDAGMMLLQTVIHPGARVIECGSGSGALTTILANFVRPGGRVFSYERRPEFSANSQANVKRYGLAEYCEFFVRDPEHEGFEQEEVDALLLDLPEPWTLVWASHRALKGGYALVAIVPTVEQVRKTVSALEIGGFARIRAKEMLERSILVRHSGIRPADRMVAHTVYLIFAHKVMLLPADPGARGAVRHQQAEEPSDDLAGS